METLVEDTENGVYHAEKGFWDAFWAVKSLSHVAGTSET